MNDTKTISTAMVVSALGWVAAVAAVALALFVGKPAYYKAAYDQASSEQSQKNIMAVDQALASRTIDGNQYVVLGKVVSKEQDRLVIETQNPYLINPLRKEPRHQTVLLTPETFMEKRVMLAGDDFVKALEEGQRKGLTTDKIQLHKKEPLTLDTIAIGDQIRVYPTIIQDAVKDTFTAQQILLVISSQSQAQ